MQTSQTLTTSHRSSALVRRVRFKVPHRRRRQAAIARGAAPTQGRKPWSLAALGSAFMWPCLSASRALPSDSVLGIGSWSRHWFLGCPSLDAVPLKVGVSFDEVAATLAGNGDDVRLARARASAHVCRPIHYGMRVEKERPDEEMCPCGVAARSRAYGFAASRSASQAVLQL